MLHEEKESSCLENAQMGRDELEMYIQKRNASENVHVNEQEHEQ